MMHPNLPPHAYWQRPLQLACVIFYYYMLMHKIQPVNKTALELLKGIFQFCQRLTFASCEAKVSSHPGPITVLQDETDILSDCVFGQCV